MTGTTTHTTTAAVGGHLEDRCAGDRPGRRLYPLGMAIQVTRACEALERSGVNTRPAPDCPVEPDRTTGRVALGTPAGPIARRGRR